ncbi:MAG: autotransporter strand-loop-strand O-heptosyltransferase, partial [Candidatus Moranbacteria bacterium CG17_big_fil_post_rev_8_21_14_2_50_44_12]
MNVIIAMGSKALGDTIAWIPYVEEFRKKHNCNVYCSTWWNNVLDYPDIHFIKPGDAVNDVYASYEVGCYD